MEQGGMRVLILGGGGTLGAFSAGALRALEQRGFIPDAMIGSSAGGINMLRWLVGGAEEAIRFWKDTASPRMLARGLLHGENLTSGILDADWFRGRVERGVDFGLVMKDKRPLSFLVVDLKTGKVTVRGNRTEPSTNALRAVSRGAYALPPLLPPVALGDEMLADGGLLYNAPLNAAVKMGATEIVYLCNVHALPHKGFMPRSTARSAWRYAEIFFRRASNVGFADAEIAEGRFRGVPFITVAPPADLRFGSLIRWMVPRVDAVQHLVDAGYKSASEAMRTWTPDVAPVSSLQPMLA
jgi:predicted acylesterase/phospholipase RssA